MLRLSNALRYIDDATEIQSIACSMLIDELGKYRSNRADVAGGSGGVNVGIDLITGSPSLTGNYSGSGFDGELCDRLPSGDADVHADVRNDEALSLTERTALAALGIGAIVKVPLFDAAELRAILYVHYGSTQTFEPREIDFVREAAERIWMAVDAARTKAALRASEARLAAAFESVPVGIAMLDNDGRIVAANTEYRRFLPNGVMPSRDPEGAGRWRAWRSDGAVLDPHDYPGARSVRGERTVPGQEMLFSVCEDEQIWTRVASVPIYDDQGRVTGQASVISDIDALKRASEVLLEQEARAQLLIDGIAVATWEAARDGLVEKDSPSWRAYTGQSFDDWKGFGWLSAIHPDDRAATQKKWRDTVRQQQAVDTEYRLQAADGSYRWMNVRAVPLRDDSGKIVKWLGMNIDIDDRKRLERALASSERRSRALVEGIPQLLWRAGRLTEWTWASPQWTAFTGQSAEDSLELGWLRMVHPEDRGKALTAWSRSEAEDGFEVEHRLRHHDGNYRWFVMRATPVRDDAGRVSEWLGTANDIDDLRQAQERQGVMVAELQHRTRNLIAVVQGLSEKTLDRASSLGDFEARFNERLSSLARVQGLLSHAYAGRKVTFDALLQSELRALGGSDADGLDDRIKLNGPRGVPLRSSAVQAFALALHELATNAVKHGALKTVDGKLLVVWSVTDADGGRPVLDVEWSESGVALPDVSDLDRHTGYGRELIERALPFQLKAKTSYAFTSDGLRCTISVPIVAETMNQRTI